MVCSGRYVCLALTFHKKTPWSYSLPDGPNTSLCPSSTTEGIHAQGLALNSTFIYFSKAWLPEIISAEDCLKDMSLFILLCILKSILAACQSWRIAYIKHTILVPYKNAFTELNFSYISSAYIERHHKKQFSGVYYHIYYESRLSIMLDSIYLYHLTFLLWESTKVLRKRTTIFVYSLNHIDLTTLNSVSIFPLAARELNKMVVPASNYT